LLLAFGLCLPAFAQTEAAPPETPEAPADAKAANDPQAASEAVSEAADAPHELRVLVLNLQNAGADENDVKIINELVANAFHREERLNVLTSNDLAQAMDLEAQKQAMDCDQSSCLAEIAGALGAKYVVHGTAGKLGASFILSLSVYDSEKAKSAGRRDIRATTMDVMPDQIDKTVAEMIVEFGLPENKADTNTGGPAVAEVETSESLMRSPLFIGGGVAAVIGVGGAVLFGIFASGQNARLNEPDNAGKQSNLDTGRAYLVAAGVSSLLGATGLGIAAWGSTR
jgi:TolB-like protein